MVLNLQWFFQDLNFCLFFCLLRKNDTRCAFRLTYLWKHSNPISFKFVSNPFHQHSALCTFLNVSNPLHRYLKEENNDRLHEEGKKYMKRCFCWVEECIFFSCFNYYATVWKMLTFQENKFLAGRAQCDCHYKGGRNQQQHGNELLRKCLSNVPDTRRCWLS